MTPTTTHSELRQSSLRKSDTQHRYCSCLNAALKNVLLMGWSPCLAGAAVMEDGCTSYPSSSHHPIIQHRRHPWRRWWPCSSLLVVLGSHPCCMQHWSSGTRVCIFHRFKSFVYFIYNNSMVVHSTTSVLNGWWRDDDNRRSSMRHRGASFFSLATALPELCRCCIFWW